MYVLYFVGCIIRAWLSHHGRKSVQHGSGPQSHGITMGNNLQQ